MVEDIYDLKRKGELDEERLKAKIKEAIKSNIRKYITEEAIITGNPKRKIRIPIRGLELPEFKFGSNESGIGSGPGGLKEGDLVGKAEPGEAEAEHIHEEEVSIDEIVQMAFEEMGLPDMRQADVKRIIQSKEVFRDIRKTGPLSRLDLKRTLRTNIKRNAISGTVTIGGISREDLRFKAYEEEVKHASSAVVVAMMDVSGSMTDTKKYLVRMTLWWIKKYLERIYDGIAFEFIIHDTKALRVDEEMFFSTSTGGGTYISSAYEMALDIIEKEYHDGWNIYPFYFSDGENWDNDNDRAVAAVNTLIERARMFYYGQVGATNWATFKKTLEDGVRDPDKIIIAEIKESGDVVAAIETFLKDRKQG